jgi:hypothetical protein
MGLFDFFLSEEAQIKKNIARLTNRDSQPDDRDASAKWLAERNSPLALLGLLQRFDLALEHQLKDQAEKELVFDLLVAKGAQVLDPVRVWLRQCKSFAMPLRLLGEVGGREAAVEMGYELLKIELQKDDFKPVKKKALLVWLAEQRHAGASAAAAPFLADFDEGVRYSAVEVIAAQSGDEGRAALLELLAGTKEESNRVRVRVASVFVQRGWRVDDAGAGLVSVLPAEFKVRDGRIVRGS